MKVIIVTGTPGTGKTTLAKKLSKRSGYNYIDVSKIIKGNKLEEGYDKKRKCRIVDIKKLNMVLIRLIQNSKKPPIIDSHLSHYLPKKYVDLCIITKCDLKTLEKRLKKKGYSKDKIRENLDCEIFDVCYNEAKERGHKVMIADEKISFENIIKEII
ncbi:MAG: AAA family ATPase [Candidatus Woesearchaeota archaeon]|nr:AAA family ATPase [Candidatus Woesearchaeota archaeon]